MVSITTLLIAGTILRVVMVLYSMYHDKHFRVKYTDIDYMIITDGAAEMVHGGTPFDRATFRYTPLLSALMVPNVLWWHDAGKVFFAMCDIGAAFYCYKVLIHFATKESAKFAVSMFILFNPIVINVSTRGNSDMVVTFMSLAALACFVERQYNRSALWLGFAIHFKIYPIIYVSTLVFAIIQQKFQQTPGRGMTTVRRILSATIKSVPLIVRCAILVVVAFAVPTYLCYKWYGFRYLDDALLYHFRREDHRHNMSPYWLLMYLNMGRSALGVGENYSAGLFAFIPQFSILLYVSYRLRHNIAHACCVQTVLFIAFNKVCTVQYFVWFMPFLTFLFAKPKNGGFATSVWKGILALFVWGLTIPVWVLAAFQVEVLGHNEYVALWGASCLFFVATVVLAGWLGRQALHQQRSAAVFALKSK